MEHKTIIDILAGYATLNPQTEAILAPGRPSLNYLSLHEHINKTALALTCAGIGTKDRIAVVLPNGAEMAACFLSVSAVCVCAPLNPNYTAEEFNFYLTDLNANGIILPESGQLVARSVAEKLGIPVFDLSFRTEDPAGLFKLLGTEIRTKAADATLGGMDEVALVLHTSGTTSRPKIVPLTRRNIFFSMNNIAATYNLKPVDRVLNMMPLFHIHGLIGALSATLFTGGSVICAPALNLDDVLDWLIDLAPSWYTSVPTMHQAILERAHKHPEKSGRIKLRFIRSSSSALSPAVAEGLEKTFNAPVLEAYGMTEAAHQMASNPLPPRPHKFGSVGLQTGTTQIAILDEIGNELSPNSYGEISIRGENVMGGYENNPKANASAFTNGWLRTGDLGYLDENGYLFIQGRSKEMINRGGEKIAPREIDDVLLQHPAVKQAVAFAAPHSTLGEDVAAAVVLREGRTLTPRELRQFASLKLAEFKVPRQIVILDEIPKGPTGKIQRIGLAEKLKAQLDAAKTESGIGADDAPRTPIEQELVGMWCEILGLESIGIHSDFLELGGDSLRAMQLLSRVNKRYGRLLTIHDMFDTPTVADLAALLEKPIKDS